MRKGLTILGILFIILIVFGGLAAPRFVAGALQAKIASRLAAEDVQVDVAAVPPVAVLWGQFSHLHAVARQAKVGEVYLSQLSLDGTGVRLDMKSFLDGDGLRLDAAEQLTLRGYVSEDNLKELITRKAEKLEDASVKITPEAVQVTGTAKIAGRKVDASLEGIVLEDGGSLYFRVTRLNLKNSLLGMARLDSFLDDILLMKADKLPLGAEFQDVAMKDGKVVITAGRKKNEENQAR